MTLTAFEIREHAEPIPGYVLEHRLGTGGFGEVWRATAPGGLSKAIKFIYGHAQERRAARELKSLNRVRELNHPFLLTVERIEDADGLLTVVMMVIDTTASLRIEPTVQVISPRLLV